MTELYALDVSLGSKESTKPPPALPGESPTRDELKLWIDAWDKHVANIGVMPFVQGVDHPAFATMVDYDMTTIPPLATSAGESAVAAREAVRAQRQHENTINQRRRAQLEREHKHRLALDIIVALRPHAGLRLKRLLTAHLVSGTVNTISAVV